MIFAKCGEILLNIFDHVVPCLSFLAFRLPFLPENIEGGDVQRLLPSLFLDHGARSATGTLVVRHTVQRSAGKIISNISITTLVCMTSGSVPTTKVMPTPSPT